MFFHANLLHAALPCWCLLSFVFLSAFLCVCMVAVTAPMSFATEGVEDSTTAIDLDQFIKNVEKANYNYDGKGITVKWSPVSGCYDTRENHNCTVSNVRATGNTPNCINSELAQYYEFFDKTDVTVKNVHFVYEAKDFIICANNNAISKSWSKDTIKTAQFYMRNSGNTTIEGCTFDNVVFTSFENKGTTTVTNSTFKNAYNSYGIKDLGGSAVSITGCTFENCSGGVMLNSNGDRSASAAVTITGNTFKNVDVDNTAPTSKVGTRGLIQIASSGDYSNTAFDFSGNKAENCGPAIRQKNTSKNAKVAANQLKNLTGVSKFATSDSLLFNAVAKIGNTEYESLDDAVAAANGNTIILLENTEVSSTIKLVNTTCTIDLNGFTITGKNDNGGCRVFSVGNDANLTLSGKGVVTTANVNGQHFPYNSSVIVVDSQPTTDKGNATLTIAEDVEIIAPVSNGISVFGCNDDTAKPTITVNGTVKTTADKDAAVIGNGSYGNVNITIGEKAKLSSEKSYVIYFPAAGHLTINGGTLIGDGGIECKAGATEITVSGNPVITATGVPKHEVNNNGSSTEGYAIAVVENKNYAGAAKVRIDSGYYTGMIEILSDTEVSADRKATIAISGGYFTSDPSAYCVTGKTGVVSGNKDYPFTVGNLVNNVKVEPADPEASADTNGKSYEVKSIMDSAVNAITSNDNKTEITGLNAVGGNEAANVTTDDIANASKTLSNSGVSIENKTVTVYVQPYMDITIKDAVVENNVPTSLTLDIVPKVKKVASTADSADGIILSEDTGTTNAVILENREVTVTTPVTLTIPLPLSFVTENLKVKHEKNGKLVGYHDAIYNNTDNTITFINDKDFSTFTVLSDARNTTIQFTDKDGNNIDSAKSYGPSDVNEALPTTEAENGYIFNGWKFDGIDGVYTTLTDDLLTALNDKTNVEAKPNFYKRSSGSSSSSSNTYKVTTSAANNGGVNVSPSSAVNGATITITLSPDKGYKLEKLTVTDNSGKSISTTKKSDTVYTFVMPASQVKVSVSYVKDDADVVKPATGFDDVAAAAWYANAVKYAVDKGMMNGVGNNKFAPDGVTDRGMIVTVLYRLENEPTASAASFTDVASGAYYANAVAWASANGIVTGYGNGKFGPNDPITREQFASILYRYAQYKKYDVSVGEDTNILSYTDAQSISSYAVPAIQWACGAGVMNGSNGRLSPKSGATRAQAAQLLMNFCENAAK